MSDEQEQGRGKIYPPNPYPYSFIDNYLHPSPPSLGGGIMRPRQHTCTVCGEEEGFHNDWGCVVGENCAPGLREVLNRAFDDYCTQRRKELSE